MNATYILIILIIVLTIGVIWIAVGCNEVEKSLKYIRDINKMAAESSKPVCNEYILLDLLRKAEEDRDGLNKAAVKKVEEIKELRKMNADYTSYIAELEAKKRDEWKKDILNTLTISVKKPKQTPNKKS